MGLFEQLRDWLTGSDTDESEPEEPVVDPESPTSYQCSICGTGVEADADECPLCRSTDIVPAKEETDGGQTTRTATTIEPSRRHATDDPDDPAAKLRETERIGRTLAEHRDRWEVTDRGIRVETDDGTQVVDSREQVAALLEESR